MEFLLRHKETPPNPYVTRESMAHIIQRHWLGLRGGTCFKNMPTKHVVRRLACRAYNDGIFIKQGYRWYAHIRCPDLLHNDRRYIRVVIDFDGRVVTCFPQDGRKFL